MTALAASEPYVRWLLIGMLFMLVSLALAMFVAAMIGAGSEREASDLHDPLPMIAERREHHAELGRQIDAARNVTPFAVVRDDIADAAERAITDAARTAREVGE